MKKIAILFIIILSISCFSQQVKKENLTRSSFEYQKTFILRQMPVDFITIYNVWKYYPVDFTEFTNFKEMQEAKLFKVKQKITFIGNHFVISDKTSGKKFDLIEEYNIDSSSDGIITYKIHEDKKIIGTINQIYSNELFTYDFIYKDETYKIEGEIKKFGQNIHSFVFNIKTNDAILGTIFKQYKYFQNEYEIIINRAYNNIDDPIFICFGVFIDQILKENGYFYK